MTSIKQQIASLQRRLDKVEKRSAASFVYVSDMNGNLEVFSSDRVILQTLRKHYEIIEHSKMKVDKVIGEIWDWTVVIENNLIPSGELTLTFKVHRCAIDRTLQIQAKEKNDE